MVRKKVRKKTKKTRKTRKTKKEINQIDLIRVMSMDDNYRRVVLKKLSRRNYTYWEFVKMFKIDDKSLRLIFSFLKRLDLISVRGSGNRSVYYVTTTQKRRNSKILKRSRNLRRSNARMGLKKCVIMAEKMFDNGLFSECEDYLRRARSFTSNFAYQSAFTNMIKILRDNKISTISDYVAKLEDMDKFDPNKNNIELRWDKYRENTGVISDINRQQTGTTKDYMISINNGN